MDPDEVEEPVLTKNKSFGICATSPGPVKAKLKVDPSYFRDTQPRREKQIDQRMFGNLRASLDTYLPEQLKSGQNDSHDSNLAPFCPEKRCPEDWQRTRDDII